MQAMRLQDAYETRKAFYLLAAITDPKKRRTLKPAKLQLIKPEREPMTAKEIIGLMKLYSRKDN